MKIKSPAVEVMFGLISKFGYKEVTVDAKLSASQQLASLLAKFTLVCFRTKDGRIKSKSWRKDSSFVIERERTKCYIFFVR